MPTAVRHINNELEVMMFGWFIKREVRLFLGGVLFGTAGLKILGSRDAKRGYAHLTAAFLRAKDEVMKNVTSVREACSDILADARDINAKRAADAAVIIDGDSEKA